MTNHLGRAQRLLPALAIVVFAGPAFAFQPLLTDDTGTQGEAGNQLEFSIDSERTRQGSLSTRTRTVPITFTRGLSDTLDAFAGIGHVQIRSSTPGIDASGGGNPVLGLKWRFFEGAAATSLALKPEVLLPVSQASERQGLGNGRASWALTLVATQELGVMALHANLGIGRGRFRDPATPASSLRVASIAPVWNVAPNWALALDLGTTSDKAGAVTTRSRFAELGATYAHSENLDFALGLIRTTHSAAARASTRSATAGLTWRFR
ncbi:MAG: transporter [Burkholderiaceae bacterium]